MEVKRDVKPAVPLYEDVRRWKPVICRDRRPSRLEVAIGIVEHDDRGRKISMVQHIRDRLVGTPDLPWVLLYKKAAMLKAAAAPLLELASA